MFVGTSVTVVMTVGALLVVYYQGSTPYPYHSLSLLPDPATLPDRLASSLRQNLGTLGERAPTELVVLFGALATSVVVGALTWRASRARVGPEDSTELTERAASSAPPNRAAMKGPTAGVWATTTPVAETAASGRTSCWAQAQVGRDLLVLLVLPTVLTVLLWHVPHWRGARALAPVLLMSLLILVVRIPRLRPWILGCAFVATVWCVTNDLPYFLESRATDLAVMEQVETSLAAVLPRDPAAAWVDVGVADGWERTIIVCHLSDPRLALIPPGYATSLVLSPRRVADGAADLRSRYWLVPREILAREQITVESVAGRLLLEVDGLLLFDRWNR